MPFQSLLPVRAVCVYAWTIPQLQSSCVPLRPRNVCAFARCVAKRKSRGLRFRANQKSRLGSLFALTAYRYTHSQTLTLSSRSDPHDQRISTTGPIHCGAQCTGASSPETQQIHRPDAMIPLLQKDHQLARRAGSHTYARARPVSGHWIVATLRRGHSGAEQLSSRRTHG